MKEGSSLRTNEALPSCLPQKEPIFYIFLELPSVGTGSLVNKREARRVGWIEQTLLCKICKRNYIAVDDIMIRHNILQQAIQGYDFPTPQAVALDS